MPAHVKKEIWGEAPASGSASVFTPAPQDRVCCVFREVEAARSRHKDDDKGSSTEEEKGLSRTWVVGASEACPSWPIEADGDSSPLLSSADLECCVRTMRQGEEAKFTWDPNAVKDGTPFKEKKPEEGSN